LAAKAKAREKAKLMMVVSDSAQIQDKSSVGTVAENS
jgi:hypothetical protein